MRRADLRAWIRADGRDRRPRYHLAARCDTNETDINGDCELCGAVNGEISPRCYRERVRRQMEAAAK